MTKKWLAGSLSFALILASPGGLAVNAVAQQALSSPVLSGPVPGTGAAGASLGWAPAPGAAAGLATLGPVTLAPTLLSPSAPRLDAPQARSGLRSLKLLTAPASLDAGGALPAVPFLAPESAAVAAAEAGSRQPPAAMARLEEGRGLLRASAEPAPSSSAHWSSFWHGGARRLQGAADAVEAVAPAPRASGLARIESPAARAPLPAAGRPPSVRRMAGVLPAFLAIPLPAWLPAVTPYLKGLGVLSAAWIVNKAVRRIVAAIGQEAGWTPQTQVVARLLSNIAVWTAGGTLALKTAGMAWPTLLASLGIGSLAMTLAVKDFLGNFLQGVQLLLNHPFDIGDRVTIDGTAYTVQTMDLRYLYLRDEPGTVTLMTYTQLADKPITIYKEWARSKGWIQLRRRGPRPSPTAEQAPGRPGAPGKRASWLSRAMPGMATLAAGVLAGALFHDELLKSANYLTAGAVALVTWKLAGFVSRVIDRLAKSRDWDPNASVVMRMAAQAFTYAAGLATALRIAGATWAALGASLGLTGVAFGVAASDMIGDVLQGAWLMLSQPFTVGDRIRAGDHEGTVHDLTLRYVVLKAEGPEEAFVLLPHSFVKSATLKVYKERVRGGKSGD